MKTKKRILVVYHNEDADGLVSAAIIWCYLNIAGESESVNNITTEIDAAACIDNFAHVKQTGNVLVSGATVDFLGVNYAQLSDMVLKSGGCDKFTATWKRKYTNIIMTDISFNEFDVMLSLYKKYQEDFIWFDHHKPVIDASFKLGFNSACGLRETSTSAILLTYQLLFNIYKMNALGATMRDAPMALRLLAGYDSWQPEAHDVSSLEDALCFTRGFEHYTRLDLQTAVALTVQFIFPDIYEAVAIQRCGRLDFVRAGAVYKTVTDYCSRTTDSMMKEIAQVGQTVVQTYKNMWKRAADLFGDSTFNIINNKKEKERTLVLFMQAPCTSLMFDFLKETQTKHVCVFKRNPTMCKDKQWLISLYNVNDDDKMHVGYYLREKYRGGGHKGAGGATISQETFDRIMKEKII